MSDEDRTETPDATTRRGAAFTASALAVARAVARVVAGLVRWSLLILLVFVGPLLMLTWTVGPRVTDPVALVGEAIDLGLTEAARTTLIDQVAAGLDDEEKGADIDFTADALARGLTQEWVDAQLTGIAGKLGEWLEATGDDLPEYTVDLRPVKEAAATDPEARLSGIPDTIPITLGGEDREAAGSLFDGRDRLQLAHDVFAVIPIALAVVILAIVLFARSGRRLRWLGAALVLAALPTLAIAALAPSFGAEMVSGSVPEVIPLDESASAELLRWVTAPTRNLAIAALVAGGASLAAGPLLRARTRRVVQAA